MPRQARSNHNEPKLNMKLFSKICLLCCLLIPPVCEGQEQLAGFVFANAIGVNAKADATASGKKLTRKGLDPGMATSGLGLPVGGYQLQVTAQGCEPANTALTIKAGTTPIIAAYLERRVDPRTNTTRNFIRLLPLTAQPQESQYLIQVVSVDPTTVFNASANGQTQPLQAFKPAAFASKTVKITDSTGASEEAKVDEKGSYYCFVFRKADGKPGTTLVLQKIYQW